MSYSSVYVISYYQLAINLLTASFQVPHMLCTTVLQTAALRVQQNPSFSPSRPVSLSIELRYPISCTLFDEPWRCLSRIFEQPTVMCYDYSSMSFHISIRWRVKFFPIFSPHLCWTKFDVIFCTRIQYNTIRCYTNFPIIFCFPTPWILTPYCRENLFYLLVLLTFLRFTHSLHLKTACFLFWPFYCRKTLHV